MSNYQKTLLSLKGVVVFQILLDFDPMVNLKATSGSMRVGVWAWEIYSINSID